MSDITRAATDIHRAIADALVGLAVVGKIGKSTLQPLVAAALTAQGFVVDLEDSRGFLTGGQPVWRSKDTGEIEATRGRRRIDIVVYRADGRITALIETESDLDDLKAAGVSQRKGHYDVFSIGRNGSGEQFHSYKSLERMAAAAFLHADAIRHPNKLGAISRLKAVSSSDPLIHNPLGLGLFLVTGRCRLGDRVVLAPRLASLGARLVTPGQL